MKRTVLATVTAILAIVLVFVEAVAGVNSLPAQANSQSTIVLNGTMLEGEPGFLNPKASILSSGTETKVNYRVVPEYSSGEAAGVRVTIYLPSMIHTGDGEYSLVSGPGTEATPMGVQGRVAAGSGWNILPDNSQTVFKGGSIVMEYDGNLGAGGNPSFDLFLSTYVDPNLEHYSSVPEGTTFELNGGVSYEQFNFVEGTSWSTPNVIDPESRVLAISSDLRWESAISADLASTNGNSALPIWDRYQYADYVYSLRNTSENLASNIDGYSVTFNIDSTDSMPNGIIPFDLNRFTYNPGGAPTPNTDPDYTGGKFIGVPGEGGVLIYDISNWDGESELTDPLPYTYTGSGLIMIDRENGDAKHALTPEGAIGDTEDKYLISLPLSRQGFKNVPTKFKLRATTNVLFAKTANWTKTEVVEREVVYPEYDFRYTHTTAQPDVVFGYETFNELKNFENRSNAPVFDPVIDYTVPESFALNRVEYEFDVNDAARFAQAQLTYTHPDDADGSRTLTPTTAAVEGNEQRQRLIFDTSALLDENGEVLPDWDRQLKLTLTDRVEAYGASLPLSIKFYGESFKTGVTPFESTLTFHERYASNDDYNAETTYTNVEHPVVRNTQFRTIYPQEAIPSIRFQIGGAWDTGTVTYGQNTTIDVFLGMNDNTAEKLNAAITLNTANKVAFDNSAIVVKKELFAQVESPVLKYVTLDGEETEISLEAYTGTEDVRIEIADRIAKLVLTGDRFTSTGPSHLIRVEAQDVRDGLSTQQVVQGTVSTYQPRPYDRTNTRTGAGTVNITLPKQLTPVTGVTGIYGNLTPVSSPTVTATTNVSYESEFDLQFALTTGGVNSPESSYSIDLLAVTGDGELTFNAFALHENYLDHADSVEVVGVDADGAEIVMASTFSAAEFAAAGGDKLKKIIIRGENLMLDSSMQIATLTVTADLQLGSSQNVRGTFSGLQEEPYETTKFSNATTKVLVPDTKTNVQVEGVNQVSLGTGVGNQYSMQIYRHWWTSYYSTHDYTLDQGYKSLGGFTASFTRPTETFKNNNQTTTVDVDVPEEHFDAYYIKINDKLKPYLQNVSIYRENADGTEYLWKTVPASEWVANTQEATQNFWRINTARADVSDAELYASYANVEDAAPGEHPYYKSAWENDVRPAEPVTRVQLELKFERLDNFTPPQLGGNNQDVIEYMGRFHSTSPGKKLPTTIESVDTVGLAHELTRTHSHSVNSLVNYPYAETSTGAADNTSRDSKTVMMGSNAEFKASVLNVNPADWCCYGGHGKDIYSPAHTEYDEWLGSYEPSSFHDRLVYEFTYPKSVLQDDTYYYGATHVAVPQSSTALKYLTGIQVWDTTNTSAEPTVEIAIPAGQTETVAFKYLPGGETGGAVDPADPNTYNISLGTSTLTVGEGDEETSTSVQREPSRVRLVFSEIAGFGENTSEIDGVNEDRLGANLNEVDVLIGGTVNGNKELRGTTRLYRDPADGSGFTQIHTSDAAFVGYTPRLGATLELTMDRKTIYDYALDGITPNTSTFGVGVVNGSEADIKDVTLNFNPHTAFRSQLIEIPAEVFEGASWRVKTGVAISLRDRVVTVGTSLFVLNEDTQKYELDLLQLFANGTLTATSVEESFGVTPAIANAVDQTSVELLVKDIRRVSVTFEPLNSSVALWGSLIRADAEAAEPGSSAGLSPRMIAGESFFVTGVWVDEEATGSSYLSKPGFVSSTSKASEDTIQINAYSNVTATVSAYQRFVTNQGSTNNAISPSRSEYTNIINRVAKLELSATQLNNDNQVSSADNLIFWDAETGKQVSYQNMVVGDTAKTLYRLRNSGEFGNAAGDDYGTGDLPVYDPLAHIVAPAGLKITGVQAVHSDLTTREPIALHLADKFAQEISADQVSVAVQEGEKRADLRFFTTLLDNESVFFLVEFEAVDDFAAGTYSSQAKKVTLNAYARPAYAHHFQSYNATGVNHSYATGATAQHNYDGVTGTEHLARVQHYEYAFANPNQLRVVNGFTTENVSGEDFSLTVQNIRNEPLHSNTNMELLVTLDTKLNERGFELTEFPTPTYPAGFIGQYAEPRLLFKQAGETPEGDTWVPASDFDPDVHALADINVLKIDYGVVPDMYNGEMLQLPNFSIVGKGHWRANGNPAGKTYTIQSSGELIYTHFDASAGVTSTGSYPEAARYRQLTTASSMVYKAMPLLELNLQSFQNRADANAAYQGDHPNEKDSYVAGEPFSYRITAKNHTTREWLNTSSAYGKAPFVNPVIFDKIPEYLNAQILGEYVTAGTLDIAQAMQDGVIEIRMIAENGTAREITASGLPTVTVSEATGLDVGGAQQFDDSGNHNSGWGLLSSASPAFTSKNPAEEISFSVVTYDFKNETIGRGETLEIVYDVAARTDDLPYATYSTAGKTGKSVYAPMLGWYGSDSPVATKNSSSLGAATTQSQHKMDMASLLHDVGVTGKRDAELTKSEFLSQSFSWRPGSNAQRLRINSYYSTQDTWYDQSANKQLSGTAYLQETAHNRLFTGTAASAAEDDNFKFATMARVNDDQVTADERILWAQDGVQLERAWLYGASEMVTATPRNSHGTDTSNFYEHDGQLNEVNTHRWNYTPYTHDDYTYAVELHEEFTIRLHASNLGDREIQSGLVYTEVLPLGVTPYDLEGNLLGIRAFDGNGMSLPESAVLIEVLQTPDNDQGFRAPAQSQEAGTYATDTDTSMTPFVVRVTVDQALSGEQRMRSAFNSAAYGFAEKNQRVDIQARVYEELSPESPNGLSYWYDEFTLTTSADEEYLETYDASYGAFNRQTDPSQNAWRYPNDGMAQGQNLSNLAYVTYQNSSSWYTTYLSFEPYGHYVRGLNAQATSTTVGTRPAVVTGDQLAMRKPTLRVWSTTKNSNGSPGFDATIQNHTVDPYKQFTISSTVENHQLETMGEYNRNGAGYNWYSGDNFNQDIWNNAPQTIGGARGGYFNPVVTVSLPNGIVPVMHDGSYITHETPLADAQNVQFTARVQKIDYRGVVVGDAQDIRDVTEHFTVSVERLNEPGAGYRYQLHFLNDGSRAADVPYGYALVIEPEATAITLPGVNSDSADGQYQQIQTFASSSRPVFNPIVSSLYTTGSVPSTTSRDQGNGTAPNNRPSNNGSTIRANDQQRPDSSSAWKNNMGVQKITERLTSATQTFTADQQITVGTPDWSRAAGDLVQPAAVAGKYKHGAYGGTVLNTRVPSIHNDTKTALTLDDPEQEVVAVDASGKYWYSTKISNGNNANENPYEKYKKSADIYNSRFVVSHYITGFGQPTDNTAIRLTIDGVETTLTRAEYEALGYTVQFVTGKLNPEDPQVETRRLVQWIVTPPRNALGTKGALLSGDDFKFMYEVQLIDGYMDDVLNNEERWKSSELKIGSYVSLITDDLTLLEGSTQAAATYVTQQPETIEYHTHRTDASEGRDINNNGDELTHYAFDGSPSAPGGLSDPDNPATPGIEIIKPEAEVRVNTVRPRVSYSNGAAGDNYFNTSDIIQYVTTHAKVTGTGLRDFVVENIIPTHAHNDSDVPVSQKEITTSVYSVTTGNWELPVSSDLQERLDAAQKTVDEMYRVYVYYSNDPAVSGYESLDGWTLLNEGGSALSANDKLIIPTNSDIELDERRKVRKIRTVIKSADIDNFLVPSGTRLAVDANPEVDGIQEVIETDPENRNVIQLPDSVINNGILIEMGAISEHTSTLFIHDTVQAWGNYVADRVTKLDQSVTRSYLTPSRPVVNILYGTQYYRSDRTQAENQRFGWSDITTVNTSASKHLKFTGQFINADDSMWSRDEDNAYAEDTLIDPVMTFELPDIVHSNGDLVYIAEKDVPGSVLDGAKRTRFALDSGDMNIYWTYRIERAACATAPESAECVEAQSQNLSVARSAGQQISSITGHRAMIGPWNDSERNVFTSWFSGVVYPGDMVVVEFVSQVTDYVPGVQADALKSKANLSNNTGIVQPLNSRQNADNQLGYSLDTNDFTDNNTVNDRLVFVDRNMFSFEVFDNFGKRKTAHSSLNAAGTTHPQLTPVNEGAEVEFRISVDNSLEVGDKAYPYPVLYDVLPYAGDTSIINEGKPRNSQYSAVLNTENFSLVQQGSDAQVFPKNAYTVFVGPLKKTGSKIEVVDLPATDLVSKQSFYETSGQGGIGLPNQTGTVRDDYFVKLSDVKAHADADALLAEARSLLVLMNDGQYKLPGNSRLVFNYSMKLPLNAPAYLEQQEAGTKTAADYAIWNSFMATQRTPRFLAQESNNAGAYATQQQDKVYVGNYVWRDLNYNGVADEGTLERGANGRWLLTPDHDLNGDGTVDAQDDPGVNGVTVSLLTPRGYHVDRFGNPIHLVGNEWRFVDEETGQDLVDLGSGGQTTVSTSGPVTAVTETDYFGNQGYYTFSNVAPGDYRVMFEFPAAFDSHGVTTTSVFERAADAGTAVEFFTPGETIAMREGGGLVTLPSLAAPVSQLTAVTGVAPLHLSSTDEERMSFDLGVAQMVTVGGTIFKEDFENEARFNGLHDSSEPGINGYHVTLRQQDGAVVTDHRGNELIAVTAREGAADGRYRFTFMPLQREYYATVTDTDNAYNYDTVVSPIMHNADPFAALKDNDGFAPTMPAGAEIVRTNVMDLSLEKLYAADGFADRLSVNVGFYEKSAFGTIGNRVWDDLNRNGIQDAGEPGLGGQTLRLEQWIDRDGIWEKTSFDRSLVSNDDGYYVFKRVPAVYSEGTGANEVDFVTRYQVVVPQLIAGYTFAQEPYVGEDAGVDSNFYRNGTMHEGAVGEHLVSVLEERVVAGEGSDISVVQYGVDDNTVDLGLVQHALASLSGEIFTDVHTFGTQQNDETLAEERYDATLQVLHGGAWKDVWFVAKTSVMVEPVDVPASKTGLNQAKLSAVNAYQFDNLRTLNRDTLEPYEYRVMVTEIPLWQNVTDFRVGDIAEVDSDFTSNGERADTYTAVSAAFVLAERETFTNAQQLHHSFTGVDATHVDLGLKELQRNATVGDRIWFDANENGLQDDDELGVAGARVVLNAVIDRAGVPTLEAVAATNTAADGSYSFEAPVADAADRPISYVVELHMASRWTLTECAVESTSKGNSQFMLLEAGRGLGNPGGCDALPQWGHQINDSRHTALTHPFVLADTDDAGLVRYETTRNDLRQDGGVIAHESQFTLGDTVYEDLDRNGMQDLGEPGIPDLTVLLYKLNLATGVWEQHSDLNGHDSFVTDAAGHYEFVVEVADLDDTTSPHYRAANQYRVLVEAPAHMRLVEQNSVFMGADDPLLENHSGIEIERPFSYVLTNAFSLVQTDQLTGDVLLETAADVLTADAGFEIFATEVEIGGRIWEDSDSDGVQSSEETGIPGRQVQLWELIDGVWVHAADAAGNTVATTDVDGAYRFTVAPTFYDETQDNFLHLREYRVTSQREGFEHWAPLHQGEDATLDSDAEAPNPEYGNDHTAVTPVFNIVELLPAAHGEGGGLDELRGSVTPLVNIETVHSDTHMDFGLKTYPGNVKLGGQLWNDSEQDGVFGRTEQPLAGVEITLWEFVDGEWLRTQDADGNASVLTDASGRYAFNVSPAHFDPNAPNYLHPREYRTTMEFPEGYALSPGAQQATVQGMLIVSQPGLLVELDEQGLVLIAESHDDETLHFPVVLIPALAVTGGSPITGIVSAALLLGGIAFFVLGLRRRVSAEGAVSHG